MKVIISRKGFDAKYGGYPSPIFKDGSMLSLPIPSKKGPISFSDINFCGHSIGPIVSSLTNGNISDESKVHLDPDLEPSARARIYGWKPCFGQTSGALTHLDNCDVGVGDLFLFFGWFRQVDSNIGQDIKKLKSAKNQHVLFGWLQIGEMLNIDQNMASIIKDNPWLIGHPHLVGKWENKNRIYVASEKLNLPFFNKLNTPLGGGVFSKINKTRVLTHPDQPKRSIWMLPEDFGPEKGIAKLSCHMNKDSWSKSSVEGMIQLQSAAIGQEFVLSSNDENIVMNWLKSIFICNS